MKPVRLLYYLPYVDGGMADYAFHQLPALVAAGLEVTLLCPMRREGPWWKLSDAERPYALLPRLRGVRRHPGPAWVRKPRLAADFVADGWTLAAEVRRGQFPLVLFGAFFEYLAPFWTPPLRWLASRGKTVFGSIVHDPARDHIVGPQWWHRWSIACSYSILREAFVHAPVALDTVRPVPRMRTTVIPHGLYEFPPPEAPRAQTRRDLALPEGARVLLSFGHIRDGKNLDLVLRALRDLPDIYLVVAGREQSGGQRPAGYYRALAEELGVTDRCRWLVQYVAPEEVGSLFAAADLLLLTYSARFRSASGVLNAAVAYRIPCLASGGEGNLRHAVQTYGLGLWIEPDWTDAIHDGLRRWLAGEMPPARWDAYAEENSWRRNAEIIAGRLAEQR